jgi:hypothetical protein
MMVSRKKNVNCKFFFKSNLKRFWSGSKSVFRIQQQPGSGFRKYLDQDPDSVKDPKHWFGVTMFNCKIISAVKGTWQRGGFSGVFAEIGSA